MENKEKKFGPRIYNLFPRLVDRVDKWDSHFERIKKMKFDWIYLNPVNYTGFSGSLYSIKDFYKFNPIFAPENTTDQFSWNGFKDFTKKAHEYGFKIMYDLVINHTSIDSPLIDEHPEWFTEKWAMIRKDSQSPVMFFEGEEKPEIDEEKYPPDLYKLETRIASPFAIDPADATKITIWGDLAEINNNDSSDLNDLTEYWLKLLDFYLDLGIDGFRCDAAYQLPTDMWRILIDEVKDEHPDVIFLAETLGCTLPQLESTVEAGFDYINNSVKWWDYTEPWLLEQYNEFRKYAPSIGFPESHDTPRIAQESGGRKDVQEFKYFFASFFSAGIMMPIGYEFGFKKKPDVIRTTPEDWEKSAFDITESIKKINQFKMSIESLNEDGPIEQYEYSDSNILIMKKSAENKKQEILLIYNKDWNDNHNVCLTLRDYLKLNRTILKFNIDRIAKIYKDPTFEAELKPNEIALFLEE